MYGRSIFSSSADTLIANSRNWRRCCSASAMTGSRSPRSWVSRVHRGGASAFAFSAAASMASSPPPACSSDGEAPARNIVAVAGGSAPAPSSACASRASMASFAALKAAWYSSYSFFMVGPLPPGGAAMYVVQCWTTCSSEAPLSASMTSSSL